MLSCHVVDFSGDHDNIIIARGKPRGRDFPPLSYKCCKNIMTHVYNKAHKLANDTLYTLIRNLEMNYCPQIRASISET